LGDGHAAVERAAVGGGVVRDGLGLAATERMEPRPRDAAARDRIRRGTMARRTLAIRVGNDKRGRSATC